ncbi:glycerol-3-phosphate 1-O-acyltransferase PlsY [Thermomonas sp.]|uniref:glycerol-3-phosphate 1-O-acyltransferase PlsY n=1 Tax=Thermomonas sp. TaxID=1971895 RepID=UPI00248977A6|nr:glycerol-3-phosphate 1-O-acyltransferase PlsY [Thermomonas sp.]MDI1254115.1 glycerol-3-phosphate 1-O-acyltransferase PlsY [Thermomonas sp.]
MTASLPPLVLTTVLLLVAYLLGSVSGSLVLGRMRGVDIRMLGSGNAGGTNAMRTQGWKFALGVALIDVGKGMLATWFAQRWAPLGAPLSVTTHGYLAAGLAVVGHVWPLWHGFRGGKGAATLIGGLLVLWPWSLPLLLLVWGSVLVTTGYVGLSTVLAMASLPLWAWWSDAGPNRMWFAIAAALFIAFTHRSNLQRLRNGSESRFARARLLYRLHRRDQQ